MTEDQITERGKSVTDYKRFVTSSYNTDETMLKNGVDIFGTVLEHFTLRAKYQVEEAINHLRKQGITQWPDGRKLEEVIITWDKWKTLQS